MNSIRKACNTSAAKAVSGDVQKMLDHFRDFNFVAVDKDGLRMECNGESLKRNISSEWLMTNSIACDEPSFWANSKGDLSETFRSVKSIVKALPWSVIWKGTSDGRSQTVKFDDPGNALNEYMKNRTGVILRKYLFCSPEASTGSYSKLQRDRKIWWKKFSASPGRFALSQTHKENDVQFVEVQATFPWGTANVERIKLVQSISDIVQDKKMAEDVYVVTTEVSLNQSVLSFLCDSYEGLDEPFREMLRFHRKLAPYKVSIAGSASSETDERNMMDLSLLLTKQIRKCGISVLFLPDACTSPIDDQIARNDALGVPYTIVLDDKTLKNGMLGIRSRDTTLTGYFQDRYGIFALIHLTPEVGDLEFVRFMELCIIQPTLDRMEIERTSSLIFPESEATFKTIANEQSHVSLLADYVQKLMKNY